MLHNTQRHGLTPVSLPDNSSETSKRPKIHGIILNFIAMAPTQSDILLVITREAAHFQGNLKSSKLESCC